jgi:hypothetical protein
MGDLEGVGNKEGKSVLVVNLTLASEGGGWWVWL